MGKVTGIGGIFFKSNDPQASKNWYKTHLGIVSDQYGTTFEWRQSEPFSGKGHTIWSQFPKDSEYMNPSTQPFMVNFRVDDLVSLVEQLKKEGVQVVGEIMDYEYGKFAHILDPDGVKIELWEPKDWDNTDMLNDDNCMKSY